MSNSKYAGTIAGGVANGWSTQVTDAGSNEYTNDRGDGSFLRPDSGTRSPLGTSTALSTKFDLQAMVSGQALGGPECKKKINMWDLLTLYDTKKKRMEDEAAYMSNKEQQKELM